MTDEIRILRGFTEIAEGQVHYRYAGLDRDGPPLVMFHPSPASSKVLEPLIARFARTRPVYALDTLGNGDSAPPVDLRREIAPYADAHLRALDNLGVRRFDAYGSHTGGNIACEIAIAAPERLRRVILDGMSVYADDERDDMLANYAPGVTKDINGLHLLWIWNFVKDTYVWWPWYRRTAATRRDQGMPPVEVLHDKVLEVLKATSSYHYPYQAAIAYPKRARLPLVDVPVLLTCAETDMLKVYFDEVRALMPRARAVMTPGLLTEADAQATLAVMLDFLDRPADQPAA